MYSKHAIMSMEVSQGMSAYTSQSDVKYFVINLPDAVERRRFMLEQAEHFGIHLDFIIAVTGKDLTDADRSHFDRGKRALYMVGGMSPNEISCTLSHRRALKTFLDSGAAYGVILEDDALLMPHFTAAVDELVCRLHGWEVAKLCTIDGKLYPLMSRRRCRDAVVQPVFPKKIMWLSPAYMYTRRGAQVTYDKLNVFWRPSDAQIADILLRERVPTIGVTPSPIELSELSNHSCIDADAWGRRNNGIGTPKKGYRSFMQYCRYRFYIWAISCMKLRMRCLMRKLLQRQ